MTKTSAELLKEKGKLMIVDNEIVEEIENLSKKMNTTSLDVILSGLNLLKLAMGRELSLNKPGSKTKVNISTFAKLKPEVNLEGEQK